MNIFEPWPTISDLGTLVSYGDPAVDHVIENLTVVGLFTTLATLGAIGLAIWVCVSFVRSKRPPPGLIVILFATCAVAILLQASTHSTVNTVRNELLIENVLTSDNDALIRRIKYTEAAGDDCPDAVRVLEGFRRARAEGEPVTYEMAYPLTLATRACELAAQERDLDELLKGS